MYDSPYHVDYRRISNGRDEYVMRRTGLDAEVASTDLQLLHKICELLNEEVHNVEGR